MGTMTYIGAAAGLPGGQNVLGPVTTTGNNTVGGRIPISLSSGDNTFSIPTGSTSVAVILPQGISATVTFRTNLNSGDTGTAIAPVTVVTWFKKDIVSGETSVILNSSSTVTGAELDFT